MELHAVQHARGGTKDTELDYMLKDRVHCLVERYMTFCPICHENDGAICGLFGSYRVVA